MLGAEKQRFLQRKDYWTSNPDCFVILKEKDLYQRLVNNIYQLAFSILNNTGLIIQVQNCML